MGLCRNRPILYSNQWNGDKIDTSLQYLVGIKDSVMQGSGGCAGGDVTITGCRLNATLSNELIDMSTSTICQLGNGTCDGTTTTQVTSVPAMPTGGTYASLIALVQSKKGWFSKLTVPAGGLPASAPWPTRSCSEGSCSSQPSLRAVTSVWPQGRAICTPYIMSPAVPIAHRLSA